MDDDAKMTVTVDGDNLISPSNSWAYSVDEKGKSYRLVLYRVSKIYL